MATYALNVSQNPFSERYLVRQVIRLRSFDYVDSGVDPFEYYHAKCILLGTSNDSMEELYSLLFEDYKIIDGLHGISRLSNYMETITIETEKEELNPEEARKIIDGMNTKEIKNSSFDFCRFNVLLH